MYTPEIASKLSGLLQAGDLEGFLSTIRSESEKADFLEFAEAVEEEWRKLQIAKKNGLMDEEQISFAMSAFFNRESNRALSESDE